MVAQTHVSRASFVVRVPGSLGSRAYEGGVFRVEGCGREAPDGDLGKEQKEGDRTVTFPSVCSWLWLFCARFVFFLYHNEI